MVKDDKFIDIFLRQIRPCLKIRNKLGLVAHIFNPSTLENQRQVDLIAWSTT